MKKFPALVHSPEKLPIIENLYSSDSVYFLSSTPSSRLEGIEILGFQGCGAMNGKFVNSPRSFIEAYFSSDADEKIEDEFISNFRGAGIAFLFNKSTGVYQIIPDILGEAIVYHYNYNDVSIISGDLLQVEYIAGLLGLPLTKSLDYAAELAIASNGGLTKSSYCEVTTLDMFQYLVVTPSSVHVKTHKVARSFFRPKESYEELLNSAAHEIKQNVAAASLSSGESKIAHLTGGFDSRLVLAAIKAAGEIQKFTFYCKGDAVHQDTKIAQSAAAKVGAVMTHDPGTPAAFLASDFGGSLLGSMLMSGGMLPIGPQRGHRQSLNTLLSGGYGETFRSFYGSRIGNFTSSDALTGKDFGQKIWGEYLFAEDGNGLFSGSYIQKLTVKLDTELNKARALGVKESDLGDFLYLQIRNRYFVGIITSNWNRFINRFDPLYSPSAIKLAFKIPLEQRADNLIGYELMRMMAPELLEVPFDSEKFGPSVFDKYAYESPINYKFVRPRYSNKENREIQLFDSGTLNIPATNKDDVEYARKIKANATQVAGRAHVRDALNRVLRNYTNHELSQVFNLAELESLRRRPANTRVRIRTLYALFSGLAWLDNSTNTSRLSLTP